MANKVENPPEVQSRAICYSEKHNHLAVCNNFGEITIRDYDDLDKVIVTLKQPQEWCEMIRYSPCGTYLAAASHDNHVYIYTVGASEEEGTYHAYTKWNASSSYLTSIDWSADSQFIRINDGNHFKKYFNVADKK